MSGGIRDKFQVTINALSDHLRPHGFKPKQGRELLRVKRDVVQRLAISLREPEGERVNYVEVFPGFNYPDVERLASELQGKKPRPTFITCSMNIGLLTPRKGLLEWPLEPRTDVKVLSKTVIETVDRYAFPFWDEFSSIDALLARYESGDRRVCVGGWHWRQAAAYCIAGKLEQASKLMLEKMKTAPPEVKVVIESALEHIARAPAKH